MEIHRDTSNNLHRDNGPAISTPTLEQYFANGRLHRADGPAVIEIVNGIRGEQYYWKGIHIPESYYRNRDSLKLEEVMAIENLELRRSVLELVGFEKLAKAAKVVHYDDERGATLYKLDVPNDPDEAMVFVKVLDGTVHNGTRKQYWIRVPPRLPIENPTQMRITNVQNIILNGTAANTFSKPIKDNDDENEEEPQPQISNTRPIKTCLEAIAWTFSMKPEQYVLEMET